VGTPLEKKIVYRPDIFHVSGMFKHTKLSKLLELSLLTPQDAEGMKKKKCLVLFTSTKNYKPNWPRINLFEKKKLSFS